MQKIMLDLSSAPAFIGKTEINFYFLYTGTTVYWLSKIIQVVVSKPELNCELNEPIVPIDLLYQFSGR